IAEGSAPRLDAAARYVWFETAGDDGRRQIARYERETHALLCLTCDEPGNNRRPAPHPSARAVLFDTDRFAGAGRPFDRELMVRVVDGPTRPSRRLTWDAARDSHAIYDPSGLGIVWSRYAIAGRVLRAPVKLGHGSLSLGPPEVLARGGLAPLQPLAWSPDARSIALAGGFEPAPWALIADLASDRPARALPATSAFDASVSFSADGSLLLRAERSHGGTRVWLGEASGDLREIALGALEAWGEPTGVALAPDADAFALGQRRGREERIGWVRLACSAGEAAGAAQ
ncbi:MAG TPA: hypothetical protein VFT98_16195, partial [Myxococcota bacterium]|nr:hypothetical protein [Myxococcota bacterium]